MPPENRRPNWLAAYKHQPHLLNDYYLLPQNALILAEAERLSVTAVATLDSDCRRVTEFDSYTTANTLALRRRLTGWPRSDYNQIVSGLMAPANEASW